MGEIDGLNPAVGLGVGSYVNAKHALALVAAAYIRGCKDGERSEGQAMDCGEWVTATDLARFLAAHPGRARATWPAVDAREPPEPIETQTRPTDAESAREACSAILRGETM